MAHFNQNKHINTLVVSVLEESVDPGGFTELYKHHLWHFKQHFPNLRCWECASEANNTMLGNSVKKK